MRTCAGRKHLPKKQRRAIQLHLSHGSRYDTQYSCTYHTSPGTTRNTAAPITRVQVQHAIQLHLSHESRYDTQYSCTYHKSQGTTCYTAAPMTRVQVRHAIQLHLSHESRYNVLYSCTRLKIILICNIRFSYLNLSCAQLFMT